MIDAVIYLAINEDGDYEVGFDEDSAVDRLDNEYGGYHRKLISLTVKVTAPSVINAGVVEVPNDVGETVTVSAP